MPVVVSSHQPSASMFACMHDASGAALLSLRSYQQEYYTSRQHNLPGQVDDAYYKHLS
jgi:hypothetical protein